MKIAGKRPFLDEIISELKGLCAMIDFGRGRVDETSLVLLKILRSYSNVDRHVYMKLHFIESSDITRFATLIRFRKFINFDKA